MCGFVGMFNRDPATNNETLLTQMSQSIRHRGPDDSGYIVKNGFCVAFRRLSIIDLDNGAQPYTSPDGRFTIVFNGEIYNYLELRDPLIREGLTFTTNSEVEVICALYRKYGEKFVEMLRGMFAIAIYDSVEETVYITRDPFGIKPMYYREAPNGIMFASEMKAFIFDETMDGFKVNPALLQHYLTFQYVPEPHTITGGISILEASHYMVIDKDGNYRIEKYVDVMFRQPVKESFDSKAERLRKIITDSVEHHLISDVEVGTFLSSGIDSAIITAVASRLQPGIKALTVGFNVSDFSEVDDAAEIAKYLDVEHIQLRGDCELFKSAFEKVVWHLDSPVADPSTVAIYLIAEEAARHVKVMLSGEGADELFAGYKTYRDSLLAGRFMNAPAMLRKAFCALAKIWPEGVKGKNFLMRAGVPLEERYVGNAFLFNEAEKKKILRYYDSKQNFKELTADAYARVQDRDALIKMQYVDIQKWLKGDILVKGDRLSMAHSLEVRVPFLDREVFEFASTLGLDEKLSHGTTKYILRYAFKDYVNPETFMRPKLGYPVPVRVWLQNELYEWAREILQNSTADEYIDKNEALKMLEDHRTGKANNYRKLWAILVFVTWHRLYIAEADKTRQRILLGEL